MYDGLLIICNTDFLLALDLEHTQAEAVITTTITLNTSSGDTVPTIKGKMMLDIFGVETF